MCAYGIGDQNHALRWSLRIPPFSIVCLSEDTHPYHASALRLASGCARAFKIVCHLEESPVNRTVRQGAGSA